VIVFAVLALGVLALLVVVLALGVLALLVIGLVLGVRVLVIGLVLVVVLVLRVEDVLEPLVLCLAPLVLCLAHLRSLLEAAQLGLVGLLLVIEHEVEDGRVDLEDRCSNTRPHAHLVLDRVHLGIVVERAQLIGHLHVRLVLDQTDVLVHPSLRRHVVRRGVAAGHRRGVEDRVVLLLVVAEHGRKLGRRHVGRRLVRLRVCRHRRRQQGEQQQHLHRRLRHCRCRRLSSRRRCLNQNR
jgi:hypothetical protein